MATQFNEIISNPKASFSAPTTNKKATRALPRVFSHSLAVVLVVLLVMAALGSPRFGVQRGWSAPALTFIVNSSGDASDASPGNGVCATSGSVCTLRAAMQEANARAGADTILFDSSIVLINPSSPLPILTDNSGTTIRGNYHTWILGSGAGVNTHGFRLASDNNKLQGLMISGFNGSGVFIDGGDNNVIGVDSDTTNDDAEGNWITNNNLYGVYIYNGNNNRVAGNQIGINTGPNHTGVRIELGSENLIGIDGNGISDSLERNIISGNTYNGIEINDSDNNTVAGNYIGVNASGDQAMPNGYYGVFIREGATENIIGTNGDGQGDAAERNVISCNSSDGIIIHGANTEINDIYGNLIGLFPDGVTGCGNGLNGIYILAGAKYSNIGGSGSRSNIIAHNWGRGVVIDDVNTYGHQIRQNSIYSNGNLGIDLGFDGVTPNDLGDGDTGPNDLQNYPVITKAIANTSRDSLTIQVSLNSHSDSSYNINLFGNTTCDPSGYGEGQVFLGTFVVTTLIDGYGSLTRTYTIPVPAAYFITATATKVHGSSSEFSACKAVNPPLFLPLLLK